MHNPSYDIDKDSRAIVIRCIDDAKRQVEATLDSNDPNIDGALIDLKVATDELERW